MSPLNTSTTEFSGISYVKQSHPKSSKKFTRRQNKRKKKKKKERNVAYLSFIERNANVRYCIYLTLTESYNINLVCIHFRNSILSQGMRPLPILQRERLQEYLTLMILTQHKLKKHETAQHSSKVDLSMQSGRS